MVNLYKLLNVLEQGMSLFQLNKWKTEGIWYPITQYKKESDEIQVITNLFIADQEQYHIQLSGNYPEESEDWNKFLEENQWKIYPLLANIMQVFLPTGNYQLFYTQYPQGFISIIAKPHDTLSPMISKELKSQLSILKETNPEYIQTLKDAVTASYKAELQAIKPSSTEEEEQLNIELKDTVLKILFGPFYDYFVSDYVVSDTIWEEQDKLIEDLYYYFKS